MILAPSWVPDFSINVAAGVTVAVGGVVLVFILAKVRRVFRHRAFDAFWGSRAREGGERFCVVTGVYADTRPPAGNRYVKTYSSGQQQLLIGGSEVGSVAEARGAGYLTHAVSEHRHALPVIDSDERLRGPWDGTFVCLGSGYSNEKTLTILNLAENTYCDFAFTSGNLPAIRTKWDGSLYPIQQQPLRDRAMIVKMPNPWREGHSLVVCAGLAEPGTSGAAYFLAQNWRQLHGRYGSKPFGVVIEVDSNSDQTARPIAYSP